MKIFNGKNKKSKKIFSSKKSLFPIILLFFAFQFVDNNDEFLKQHSFYNKNISLSNRNTLIIYEKGIITYNPKLNKTIYKIDFANEESIKSEEDFLSINIAEYPDKENNFFICLIKGILFFFNTSGKFLFSYKSKEKNSFIKAKQYNIIPYKKINYDYFYIIAYVNNMGYPFLTFYKFNSLFNKNNILREKQYIPLNNNGNEIIVNDKSLSCSIIYSNSSFDALNCFFQNMNLEQKGAFAMDIEKNIFNIISTTPNKNKILSNKDIDSLNKKIRKVNDIKLFKIRINEQISKCSSSNQESQKLDLCIDCNTDKGFYPIKYIGIAPTYIDCYSRTTIPSNFFLNLRLNFGSHALKLVILAIILAMRKKIIVHHVPLI